MLHLIQPTLVWEGQYVDTWSIAHTIVGFLMAYGLYRLRYSKWHGFGMVVLFGIGWELVEQFILRTRVTEANTNSVMDVLCAAVGYLLGYWILHSELSPHDKKSIGVFAAVVFCIICALRVLGA